MHVVNSLEKVSQIHNLAIKRSTIILDDNVCFLNSALSIMAYGLKHVMYAKITFFNFMD